MEKRRLKPEKIFTSEMTASFKQYCKEFSLFYLRIQDDPFTTTTKFTHKKPFDAVAWAMCDDGCEYTTKVVALEYKAVNGEKRWPLSSVKPHQISGLSKAFYAGAEAYIMVNFRGLEGPVKTRAVLLTLETYLKWQSLGKKSVTWKEMFEYSGEVYWLERVKLESGGYGWDVSGLFSGIHGLDDVMSAVYSPELKKLNEKKEVE